MGLQQWIPDHSGIKENEGAETLAKQGVNLPQPTVPVPYDTAVQMIKLNLNEKLLNNWATNTTERT